MNNFEQFLIKTGKKHNEIVKKYTIYVKNCTKNNSTIYVSINPKYMTF